MPEFPFYEIVLPLPPSVNAMHSVAGGFFNRATRKWTRTITQSQEYKDWQQRAAVAYRNKFPGGVGHLEGRLAVHYIFCWNSRDPGSISSDINNREKCLSDFLEGRFFENDKAIDESHFFRRIVEAGQNRAICRIYAINDRRYDAPELIFNPTKEGE